MRRLLALLFIILALGACGVERSYRAEPVVGPDDRRSVDIPDINDVKAIEKQDCFEIILHEQHTWSIDDYKVGVACMVDDEDEVSEIEARGEDPDGEGPKE